MAVWWFPCPKRLANPLFNISEFKPKHAHAKKEQPQKEKKQINKTANVKAKDPYFNKPWLKPKAKGVDDISEPSSSYPTTDVKSLAVEKYTSGDALLLIGGQKFKNNVRAPLSLKGPRQIIEFAGTINSRLEGAELDQLKAMFRASGLSRKPLRIRLWEGSTFASAANTALATTVALRPSGSAEFASLAALYDIYTAHGCLLMYHIAITVAAQTVNVEFAGAYDPANSGAYASVIAIMPAEQKHYEVVGYDSASIGAKHPSAVTSRGHWTKKFKYPQPDKRIVTDPTANSAVGTGAWHDVTLTAVDFGYWKSYMTAAGTAAVNNVAYKIGTDLEFAIRS